MSPSGRKITTSCTPAASRRGHLDHPRVERARKSVDLAQRVDLYPEGGIGHRIGGRVKPPVAAGRRGGQHAAAFAHRQPGGLCGARQRGFGQFRGMRIACRLAPYRAQAKALGGVVTCRAEAGVVEHQGFRPAPFKKEFAIIAAGHSRLKDPECARAVERGVERAERIVQVVGHRGSPV
jgi:hypothetical protein